MFRKELYSEIEIESTPDRVWDVLTGFAAYAEWNPFIRLIRGKLEAGQKLEVHFASAGKKEIVFRPKVLDVEAGRELRWIGHLVLPWIFDGEHIFEISPVEGGGVNFIQREKFMGLLVPLLWKELDTNTRRSFDMMNRALKRRVEEESERP
jgi:hypothetical protein